MPKKAAPPKTRKKVVKKPVKKNGKDAPQKVSLSAYFTELRRTAVAASGAGGVVAGACLLTNPLTGQRYCVQTNEKTCKEVLRGTFIGGLCGGG